VNTKQRGDEVESQIIADLVSRGISVSRPFGDNDKYDLVIEIDGEFIAVQCKSGNRVDGGVRFNTSTQVSNTKDGYVREGYEDSVVEYFAVYCPELDESYWVPASEAASDKMKLRTEPTKNGQVKGINFTENFKFEDVVL
jgi:hypothetical protein